MNILHLLLKINGASHRASVLKWFPLTDCADAIEMKGYLTGKQTTYSLYIEKGKCPMITIMNAVGVKIIDMLPHSLIKSLKPININDEFKYYFDKFNLYPK